MKKIITDNKGFSLIELMVVVAIIGVLAAIGIPQYSKFQAKTRQSEAKTSLAALFTGEASFNAEWSHYTRNPINAGFAAQGGALRYMVGFPNTAAAGTYPAQAPGETDPLRVAALATGSAYAATPPGNDTYATATGTYTATAFQAFAWGSPNSGATACVAGTTVGTLCDIWRITELKIISNTQNGIW